jgi:hypothetical protein
MPERAEKQTKPQQSKKPSPAHESEKAPVFDAQSEAQPSNPLLDLQTSIGNQGIQRVLAQHKLKQLQPNALIHSQRVIGNRAMRQVIAVGEEVDKQFYGHGAFMGAAPRMLKDSKWRSILETLMPDVFEDVKDVTDDSKLMPMLENNPVMAAYGMLATQKLDQRNEAGRSDRIQNMEAMEWDVWLDPDVIRAYSVSFNDTVEAALDKRLLDTMIIAHGNTKQTILENTFGGQYGAVKETRKAALGGARSTAWMDLFGRALQIATSKNPDELMDEMRGEPRHTDEDDQSLYQTFEKQMPFDEVIALYKKVFGKETFSVLLDIKSRNAKPWVLRKLILELNRRGVHVYGVGSFEFSELNNLDDIDQQVDGKSMGAPRGIKFFHGIGNLQSACAKKEVFKGDHVMFNAGSILDSVDWDADKPDEDDAAIESIIQKLGEFKTTYEFKLGLYVQEGATDRRAAEKITRFSNQHADIFDLGFAWGGISNDMGPVESGGSGMGSQANIPWNEWDEDIEPGEPPSTGFDSTFSIKRVLESRKFAVKRGRVIASAEAEWNNGSPTVDTYTITLRKSNRFFDDTFTKYRFKVGEHGTARWDGLESGTYYLVIDVEDQDEATLEGDINVTF